MSRAQSRSTGRLHLAAGILTAVIAFMLPLSQLKPSRSSGSSVRAALKLGQWDTSALLLSIEFSFRGGRTYDPVEHGLSSLRRPS